MNKVVHEDDAKNYICPVQNSKPCQGKSCMLWQQNFIIDNGFTTPKSIRPPSLKLDACRGYCGLNK